MPHSPHSPFAATDIRSSASSLPRSFRADRTPTPTFPIGLWPPQPLVSPHGNTATRPNSVDSNNSNYSTVNFNCGSFSGSSRASPSTGAADGLFASLNHSFSYPPLSVTLDEEQRRCVNTAFHISFHGNSRVKHKTTCVELPNGESFLIVDRFVSGNNDGVYERNRKMWEQIPIGQARVFVRAPPTSKHSNAASMNSEGGDSKTIQLAKPVGFNNEEAGAATTPLTVTAPLNVAVNAVAADSKQKSASFSNSSPAFRVLQRLPGSPASEAAVTPSTSSLTPRTATVAQNNNSNTEWTWVGTAVGLRKIGHWREATTVYKTHKEIAKSAIALEKVDGEAGQLSAFTWHGERYWVVGCRYQHIVTRLDVPEADLMRYVTATSISTSANTSASSSSPSEPSTGRKAAIPALIPMQTPSGFPADARDLSVIGGAEQCSTHSSSGLTSEAGYLDLAVRMARLWRHVLAAIPAAAEDKATKRGQGEEEEGNNRQGGYCESAVAALHTRIAADRRTLCFDAILTGWERLQAFSALHSFMPETSRADTATSISSADSPCKTTQPASSLDVFISSSSLTASTWETEIPLWFYAITWDASLEGREWCMPVLRARDFFVASHLPFVPISEPMEMGSPEYEAMRQSVLSRCDTAGVVLYGANVNANNNDGKEGDGTVVQVWKCRAYPHTLERIVQEYVVTHRLCGDSLRNKMKKKVSSMSRETRLYIKQWELHRLPFLVDFALWLHREKYITPSTDLAALKKIRGHWLSYQQEFKDVLFAQLQRQQQQLSARPSSIFALDVSRNEEGARDCAKSEAAPAEENVADSIMLAGPQGCGKSTMSRILYALLEEAGAAPRWLNQDEVGTRAAYLAAIRRAIIRGTYSHILLDKMNLDDKARTDYGQIGVKPVLVISWWHGGGTEAMVHTCYDRVVQRGACHRTFFHDATTRSGQPPSDPVYPIVNGGVASVVAAARLTTTPKTSPAPVPSPSSSSRLHDILEASAKRYQTPYNLPYVELDITWDCKHAVEVVWAALREKGTWELPPLAELNVDAALHSAYAYERLLEAYPTRVAAAVLRGPSSEVILSQLGACRPSAIPKAQCMQPHVEVVLHDFQLNPSPTALVRYASQVGTTRRLTIQAVVSNSKVVLLLVLGPSESIAAATAADAQTADDKAESTATITIPAGYSGSAGTPSRPSSATTAGGCAVVMSSPTVSQDVEDYLEWQTQQEQWAVITKAKKVTAEYCEMLAQRVRDDPEEDPYCTVRWLSSPLTMDFTVALTFP